MCGAVQARWSRHLPQPGGRVGPQGGQRRVLRAHPEENAKRKAAAKTDPLTAARLRYLASLAEKAGRARGHAEYATAVEGIGIEPRRPRERSMTAVKRLTKAVASKLITALAAS